METVEMVEQATDGTALRLALLESRQRWRAFGAMATDLVFETGRGGLLSFVAPDTVLGHPASVLLGTDPALLLLDHAGPNPFARTGLNRRRTWLHGADGRAMCMELTTEPLLDGLGHPCGLRGVGVDVTERERGDAATAAALRRAEALDHILGRMRQEVLAPRMMQAMLDQVTHAFGADGTLVADLTGDAAPVLHAAGRPMPPGVLAAIVPKLHGDDDAVQTLDLPGGTQALCCQCTTRFGARTAAVIWRAQAARPWDDDDRMLAAAVMGVVRIVLEHETIHRELARQARTDPLTGLLNRRAFLEEAGRRLDRLETEGHPGTLMFLDLDRLKQVNDNHGHEAGDGAITTCATLLSRTFRPTDLIARLGGDEFAVWLDGADTFTAAERAEALRIATPVEMGHLTAGMDAMGLSIGIATREPGSGETLEELMNRADTAMYDVKHNGRGHWRVSHAEGTP